MMFAPLALRIVTAHIRARTILATAMVLSAVFCLGFSILCPLQRALAQEHPAQRLHDEKANKYRGGDSVPSHFSGELINKTVDPQEAITVELNMRKLFKKLLVVAGSESDKYYSPHLRDILIDIPSRVGTVSGSTCIVRQHAVGVQPALTDRWSLIITLRPVACGAAKRIGAKRRLRVVTRQETAGRDYLSFISLRRSSVGRTTVAQR
jgi:hypothetical protein